MSTSSAADALENTIGTSENEELLNSLHEKVLNWNSDHSITWEPGAQFAPTVEEIRKFIESLQRFPLNGYQRKHGLLQLVHSILQMAMSRLEKVFNSILIENRQPLEPEHLSFPSSDDDMSFVDSIASVDDDPFEDTQVRPQRDNTRGLEQYNINLVHPNGIPVLIFIAEVMFASGYAEKCCQAYISIRKGALQECLLLLGVEKLSVKDVLEMDWNSLNSIIKKWVRAVKILVRVYLTSEKSLADKVFGLFGSVGQTCFIKASKSLILQQLLNFGEAVAIRNYSPEQIVLILDMCDGLVGLLSDIHVLFSDEACSFVRTKAYKVVSRLGESVRRSFNEFRNALRTNELSTPFAGVGVHHLTRYVMNYLKALTGYSDTLNFLLKGGGGVHSPSSSNVNTAIEDESECNSSSCVSPMVQCLQSMLLTLESNLESKSQLYTDVSQQQFFLMNNIYYMVQKVKDSELQPLLGENWIRKHYGKFQQHAVNYESTSWSSVLSFLRDEGICNPGSGSAYKIILEARFLCFNLAFEEIYRTQTMWLIPDVKLRYDLQISISLKLLQAYQTFLGRCFYQLADDRHGHSYIKYSVTDLQRFLWDFFAGFPRSLHSFGNLEEEFSYILIDSKQPLEPENLPLQSSDDDMTFVDLIASIGDRPYEVPTVRPRKDNTRGLEEYIINLVHPNAIPCLKYVAEVMFASGYDAECCQAYISIRKDALQECLVVIEVEKLSIKDVLWMDWDTLNSKIKKWVRVAKIFVKVYLSSEKSLADKVFGLSGSVGHTCFIEASKSLILQQLLSFGEAIAIRNYSPEKIFPILYMCDGFLNLLHDIDVLLSDEVGCWASTEVYEVLRGLGESVTRSLNQFRNAVKTSELSTPFAGCGVHHLTRYVMNYLKALTYYSDTLNFLLEVGGDDRSPSSEANRAIDDDCESNSSRIVSPMARCLQCLISVLELNLENKSQLCTDVSLRQFFLMNNIDYMAQKMKDSELGTLMGENWIRKYNGKFQQHAVNYERASWNPVLSFLRDEGICNPRSGLVNKAILKERFRGFNLAFEEIYRIQTAWLIHNDQLREDLRISISLRILQAYRAFMGRYSNHLAGERHCDRYIKYSVEDLQEFLLDLFEGSPRSLHRSHRQ